MIAKLGARVLVCLHERRYPNYVFDETGLSLVLIHTHWSMKYWHSSDIKEYMQNKYFQGLFLEVKALLCKNASFKLYFDLILLLKTLSLFSFQYYDLLFLRLVFLNVDYPFVDFLLKMVYLVFILFRDDLFAFNQSAIF